MGYILSIFDGLQPPRQVDLESFGKKEITFGRRQDNDLVLTSQVVSKWHGVICLQQDGLRVLDKDSTNGLLYQGVNVKQCFLREGDLLRIDDGVCSIREGVLILVQARGGNSNWKRVPVKDKARFLIGRSPGCDLNLTHVGVSRQHASLDWKDGGPVLSDMGSANGTFVNGHRVRGSVALREKDLISITNNRLIYAAGYLYYRTYRSGIRVDAVHLVKTVQNKGKSIRICSDVSLGIQPGELVAIIGGSGAGKTTLMNLISGYSHPTEGKVLINGEELYGAYESLKNIIGYVPQQDIVYDNLTLFSMLDYAAKLRLPDDTAREERQARVRRVIDMVELTGKEQTMISRLSGGQKKRASIAVELLSDPSLFFLDEPASGLDPGTERNLMRTLKNMTNAGKTIILVTHSTLNLQVCDKIVFMGKGGKLCFAGNYQEAERFFRVDNLVDVYNMIQEQTDYWREAYEKSGWYYRGTVSSLEAGEKKIHSAKKRSGLRQMRVLSARYLRLMVNDRQRLLLLLLQAPALALLISFVKDGNQFEQYGMTKSLLFALSCSAFWVGILNSIQEVCKERNILKREYMTGLRLGPYILSKFLVLGILCLVQSLLLTGVFLLRVGRPEEGVMTAPELEIFATTFLTAFSAAAMGVFASSMFKNADRAMTVAPILLMPQILFSGLLFKLEGVTKVISWFAICRWSMEGYGTTANLNGLEYVVTVGEKPMTIAHEAEEFFEFTKGHLVQAWMLLAAFVVGFGIVSIIGLRNIRKNER